MDEQKLPHSISIEQAVLSTLLNDNNAYDNISTNLMYTDFFNITHQKIFKLIIDKLSKGQIADVLTIVPNIEGIDPQYIVSLSEQPYPASSINDYSKIIVELSIKRKLITLGEKLVNDNNKYELNTLLNEVNMTLDSINLHDNVGQIISLHSGTNKLLNKISDIFQHGVAPGISTGFTSIDNALGGFQSGQLIILGGRPAAGKSALAMKFGIEAAKQNYGVLLLSLEMPYDQICARAISSIAKVNLQSLLKAKINHYILQDCIDFLSTFDSLPFYIYDSSYVTLNSLRAIIKYAKRVHNVSMIIVDYIQLIEIGEKVESREQEISRISRTLKILAKDTNIVIIGLSQMSRDIEKTNSLPKLSYLRGSGSLEQDADVVSFIHREETDGKISIQFIIAKNRNGPLANIELGFDAEYTNFYELL